MSLQSWLDMVCHSLAFVLLRGAWSAEVKGLELEEKDNGTDW